MYVNRIDNTNFMALKVSSKAMPKLREMPIETLEKITEFGNRINDIELYNIHLDEKLKYSIRSIRPEDTTDYLASLRNTERLLGTHYNIVEYDGGGETTRGGWYPDEPRSFARKYGKNAPEEYKKFKALDSFGQMEQYSRMLEEFELERIAKEEAAAKAKNAEEEAKRIEESKKTSAITVIMENFGFEEPETVTEPEPLSEQKTNKNFFKRLFHIG